MILPMKRMVGRGGAGCLKRRRQKKIKIFLACTPQKKSLSWKLVKETIILLHFRVELNIQDMQCTEYQSHFANQSDL